MPKGAKEPTPGRAPAAPRRSHELPRPSVQPGICREQGLALQARAGKMCTHICADFVRARLSDSKECGNIFRTAEMRIGAGIPGGARRMGTELLWPSATAGMEAGVGRGGAWDLGKG